VFFELGPLGGGRVTVFLGRSLVASPVEELLVVADNVVVEDRDVAAGGLDAEVPEESCSDVDGQAGVDQVSREETPEVVWGEPDTFETRDG
jgi:hypothetical protein